MDKINMFTATATAMDSRGQAWVAADDREGRPF